MGPLINEEAAKRNEAWIAEAVSGGAKLLCGGKRDRATVSPAVLTGTKPSMLVNCREIFGPVVTVEKFSSFDAALAEVNHSDFGLQAGILRGILCGSQGV